MAAMAGSANDHIRKVGLNVNFLHFYLLLVGKSVSRVAEKVTDDFFWNRDSFMSNHETAPLALPIVVRCD